MIRATLRLQFHKGFTFADALARIGYFRRLGISHIYASPITTARAGSMHGYDVIDPTRVNPEFGGEEALRGFVAALRDAGLGLIIDIVPNHMAATVTNPWWHDVLKHGPASRYAPYFDIDWKSADESLRDKLLLPVLGKPLREVLAAGEITLVPGPDGPELHYFEHRYPVADAKVTSAQDGEPLDALLARQHYRLAWWRVANDEINWRRFFDINELVALRMEHAPAFEDTHVLIFRLFAEGLIDGVRVDHIDGLSDPADYCAALRRRLDTLGAERPAAVPHDRAYIVVEKILLRDETLPTDWQCDGTSGYDAMNDLSALQHDARAAAPLGALWQRISGRSADFAPEEQAARREIIARSFAAQLEACTGAFHALARAEGSEITRAALRRSLTELLAHFPVYRGYGTARGRPFIAQAAAAAQATSLPADRMVIDRLAAWLSDANAGRAVTRFWQLSAPVAAKAVEDTAFYRYGRLLSRNDVGFDGFGGDAAGFHARVLRRAKHFPHAMLASATHDHKRGEDVRARLAVISEHASAWADLLPRWLDQCRALCDGEAPHPSDIAILLQMIVGAWPLDLDIKDKAGRQTFARRLAQWQQKALREAKLRSDWVLPNQAYERAAHDLLDALLVRNEASPLADIARFIERVAPAGAVNGLAQTLLKLTLPGVPDIYQGTEFWDFSLVDPDNRRPVDFAARAAALEHFFPTATFAPLMPANAGIPSFGQSTESPLSRGRAEDVSIKTLVRRWRDGRIKQALIARVLALRAGRPKLFAEGGYEPLEVRGTFAENVVAFARRFENHLALVVVPRVASVLLRTGAVTFAPDAWKDTVVALPHDGALANALTGQSIADGACAVQSLLGPMPVAFLVSRQQKSA
jgi:malto-oligosyltrehalose synthase